MVALPGCVSSDPKLAGGTRGGNGAVGYHIGTTSAVPPSPALPSDIAVSLPGLAEDLVFRKITPAKYNLDYPEFWILETEVTNRAFQSYLRANKRTKDDTHILAHSARPKRDADTFSSFSSSAGSDDIDDPDTAWRAGEFPTGMGDHPVACITLDEANNFCQWLNQLHGKQGFFRLPTWNEWMIAAYGGDRLYPWGDTWDADRAHMGIDYSAPITQQRTVPVRLKRGDCTPEQVLGLLGNVTEMIIDEDPTNQNYHGVGVRMMGGDYSTDSETGRGQPRKDYWGYIHNRDIRRSNLGFRVVLDPSSTLSLIKRPRLFAQRDTSWYIREP